MEKFSTIINFRPHGEMYGEHMTTASRYVREIDDLRHIDTPVEPIPHVREQPTCGAVDEDQVGGIFVGRLPSSCI